MSYRCLIPQEKADDADFRPLEVVVATTPRGSFGKGASIIITIDNHWGTLHFVQANMDKLVRNIILVRKMEVNDRKKVEETEKIFERNLEPLFTLIFQTEHSNVLDKLSFSLKKALILMAMGRYSDNKDSICKALGISLDKLDKEMALCGLGHSRKTA
ncbi:MAG: hypothetical protein WA140_02805 [Geobacteraceae bacterium]